MSNAEIRGLFVWHELMTTDPQGAAAFYAGVFRWKTQLSSVPGHTLWMSGEVGVGGLMAQPEEARMGGMPPSWLVYLGTVDVDATVQAAQRLGGRVVKDAVDIPAIGRFAVLADPQGAVFAVFTPAAPAPAGAAASRVISQFSWHELATSDLQGAFDFYSTLFGWKKGDAHDMGAGHVYQIVEREGTMIGGIYRLQDPSRPPYWLAYVEVDDLDGAVASVRAAKGQIVQEPHEVHGGDRVARILDPQGGAIALHERHAVIASPAGKPAGQSAADRRSGQGTAKRTGARSAESEASTRSKVKIKTAVEAVGSKAAAGKRTAKRPATKAAAGKRTAERPATKAAAGKRTAKRPATKVAAGKRTTQRSTTKAAGRKSAKVKKPTRAGSGRTAALKRTAAKAAKRKIARRR